MAVYTQTSDDELIAFLATYDIGDLVSYAGIAEGVENSNFLLRTTTGTFILTLYEKRVDASDLPFFIGLMDHLARHGLSCPTPVVDRDGVALRALADRPAAIVTFLDGVWPRHIPPPHCRELGGALADLHLAGAGFTMQRPNNLSLSGWGPLLTASGLAADQLYHGLYNLLSDELRHLASHWPTDLPVGVIHADLFQDNVFFLGDKISGVIDFYFACTGSMAYDLAVTHAAWCFDGTGSRCDRALGRALIEGYETLRPLGQDERAALPLLAEGDADDGVAGAAGGDGGAPRPRNSALGICPGAVVGAVMVAR